MRVKREDFCRRLAEVSCASTVKTGIEQSECFVFDDGHVLCFDGNTLIRAHIGGSIVGAVPVSVLLPLLSRFVEEEVEVSQKGGQLRICGVRKEAGLSFVEEIGLPYRGVPGVMEWVPASPHLSEALVQCAAMCSTDPTQPKATVVHVASGFVEACDNHRLYRVKLDTGFGHSVLIPALSLGGVGSRGGVIKSYGPVTQFSVGEGWVHFCLESGTIVSIRTVPIPYFASLDALFAFDGKKVRLPSILMEMVHRAVSVLRGELIPYVRVDLTASKVCVSTRSSEGWYKEEARAVYDAEPISFIVRPEVLACLLERSKDAVVCSDRMKVTTEDAILVLSLSRHNEDGGEDE